ncbi:uncharacterized protein LOC111704548 isoform X2 [Eurytemora carolleeae]|uniref:uncharacterized protein LOC111704548 isoform X2 n=1 Tax=Eurytemora carolleeae TaxID=1294199 RepID=UPI000C775E8A|nr:uncharacterized protein LOC111704548 isoform X2 [Eurytemora carolleeae]|eukprot:XP_023332585.1 uncharacterized protein LOC111704548 isoform X2 [Eurytemora affinis]
MCDKLLKEKDVLLRLVSGENQFLKEVLVCCQAPSFFEETLIVLAVTLIGICWVSLVLLVFLTYSEGKTVKMRARRRSRIMNEEDGFFDSLPTNMMDGIPMTEEVVRGFAEIKNLYDYLPSMYAERAAVKIAVESREPDYDDLKFDNEAETIWRSIMESPRMEEEPDQPMETIPLGYEVPSTSWGNPWDNIKIKIRKLSEMRKSESNSGSLNSSFNRRDISTEKRTSETIQPFSKPSQKCKKLSQASIYSGFSVSSISLNEEIYDELPKGQKSILRAKTVHDRERRYKRKRRHGVSFMEEQHIHMETFSETGTV